MEAQKVFAYAQLNMRLQPIDRGERFEDPLIDALEKNGLGEVSGGGTQLSDTREIEYCGIDIDLFNVDEGAPFVCKFLTDLGAPKGSKLSYERAGQKIEVPFGIAEGLAVYLNGTDLPDEVYQQCDINVVTETFNKLLGKQGSVQGDWQGSAETALYLYGDSAVEMKKLIAGFMAEYPLCQKARIVTIP